MIHMVASNLSRIEAYELDLPREMELVHPIIHASMLRKYVGRSHYTAKLRSSERIYCKFIKDFSSSYY